jgi:hypothetical protein
MDTSTSLYFFSTISRVLDVLGNIVGFQSKWIEN